MNRDAIISLLQQSLPNLLAIYAFGSRVTGHATVDSDLDLSVLVEGYADVIALWELAGDIANIAGCDVDLLDLRAASTVMQYQIITLGERWWAKDVQAGLYEVFILSEKTDLDTRRAALLAEIKEEGKVYGR
jgi:predicted nucleotidyltransferase